MNLFLPLACTTVFRDQPVQSGLCLLRNGIFIKILLDKYGAIISVLYS